MKPSIPISSNSPRMDVQMSWWAMNGLHSSGDRQSAWSQEAKLQRIAEAGFAGVNAFIPEPAQAKEWRRLLEQYGLTLSVNAYPKSAVDMTEFIEKLRAYDGAVQYVNAQVMTPFIVDTSAEKLLHDIARLAEDARIHVFIETHRGTITQDLLRTVEYVNSLPSLRLTIDFSHYVVAGEMRTISDEAEALLQTLLTRTSCIHARVSNGEQVQVNVGEQGEHPMLSHFERWWESGMRHWLAQASLGDHFPFVCELGPPPYAITLDEYGDKSDEISDRWTQSLLLADRARSIWSRISKSQGSTGLA
ncbi:TIM barrel protein [Paenibacillus sp. RC67]|uniref:sugar phosphate isomerase/epimerase family protein n=1 Tax=Paenibacillus sp. RC67 TaxID=3039392 RepID=UPI0024AE47A4|nr:TIM barrel protein [Paenibacillus sp. RC67]